MMRHLQMLGRVGLALAVVGGAWLAPAGPAMAETVAVTNLAIASTGQAPVVLDGGGVAFVASEVAQGVDLNGDGDTSDNVLHIHDPATGTTTNLGIAGFTPVALDGAMAFAASEVGQRVDLNGDGDTSDNVVHVHEPAAETTTNLGIAGSLLTPLAGGAVAFVGLESAQGVDLNGDGDTSDNVLHVHDPASATTTNLGITSLGPEALDGGTVAFAANERSQGADLNGDGDTSDFVMHVHDPATGTTTNLGIAGSSLVALDGGAVAFATGETAQGADLNGDGDTFDTVIHVHEPASGTTANLGIDIAPGTTALGGGAVAFVADENGQRVDFNGDGDTSDFVMHVYDPATGTTTNLGISGATGDLEALDGGPVAFLAVESAEGADLNGDGDTSDFVVHVHDPATATTTNLGIAGGRTVALVGGAAAFAASETEQGVDLNGDGDTSDDVAHVHDPATGITVNTGIASTGLLPLTGGAVALASPEFQGNGDLNGDGDTNDTVPVVFDPDTETTINVGIAGLPHAALPDGGFVMTAREASEGVDLNGDGDTNDSVPLLIAFGGPADTEAPVVSATTATPNPVAIGTPVELTATVDDSATGGSAIVTAGYSVDGEIEGSLEAADGGFDEATEDVVGVIAAFATAGVREVCVTGTDAAGHVSAPECILLAVYDPEGGFVTGGGWIDSPPGAYPADPDATGRASFGFVSRYHRGASTPDGQTQFRFRAAGFTFHSTAYKWLVVSGARAQYKGSGTVNGIDGHEFLLTAIDGDVAGGRGVDRLRLKVWEQASGVVVYDNQLGEDDAAEVSTALGGGSITIHRG